MAEFVELRNQQHMVKLNFVSNGCMHVYRIRCIGMHARGVSVSCMQARPIASDTLTDDSSAIGRFGQVPLIGEIDIAANSSHTNWR